MPLKDISGKRFGRLVAKSFRREGRKTIWLCHCDCGESVDVVLGQLTSRKTKSCGCLRADKNRSRTKTHGLSRSPEYLAFRNALYRCTRKADPRYKSYGGRGIEFRFISFDAFIAHIGRRPSPKHSLDRIDSDGHYEIGNVRWSMPVDQARNKTTNRMIKINGVERPLVEWAELYGVPYKKAFERIFYGGWEPERALEVSQNSQAPAARTVVHVERMPT
jgi:hypothetical protein